jgi:hypothetical protein
MSNYKIYALTDPKIGVVRYVGQTVQSLSVRLSEHLSRAKNKSEQNKTKYHYHKHNWMRKVLSQERLPNVQLLTQVDTQEEADECEIYWIKYFNELGCDLTNITVGGQGVRKDLSPDCSKGHEFTEENTYISPNTGSRQCRKCYRLKYAYNNGIPESRLDEKGFVINDKDETACANGHLITEETTYTTPQGHFQCKVCRKLRERRRRADVKRSRMEERRGRKP